MLKFFERLSLRLRETAKANSIDATLCGKQGADATPPETTVYLSKPNTTLVGSLSGPDGGVSIYKHFHPELLIGWNTPLAWAYGVSQSMYDLGPTGRRNGEPVADCFGVLAYPEGAVLAVADGVNWGEPPRRAARCAVLGSVTYLHQALMKHEGDSQLNSDAVFRHLLSSIAVSQKLILQQFGTLTTLVMTVVLPIKWTRTPRKWAAMTMTVGDSAAYVYRAATREVEEVTAAAHAEGARDPRWCPGALGYALGEEPDLSNMMLCLTLLDEGDFVFLVSDGVADNFDPVIRKLARHHIMGQQSLETSSEGELPSLTPSECQAKAMLLLREVLRDAHSKHSGKPGGLTAQALSEHLLAHVEEVTETQRQQVESRNREREAKGPQSLSTDNRPGGFLGALLNRPPGKMDHATVACYQVGRRKAPTSGPHKSGGGGSNASSRSASSTEQQQQQQPAAGAPSQPPPP